MGQVKVNTSYLGMNLDSVISQVKPGQVTYAQNAQVIGFEGNRVTYQNEQGLISCFAIPTGYTVIGTHNIVEKNFVIYFLVDGDGNSEIGKVQNCLYSTIINASCLNFSLNYPIQKVVHKITSCSTEVYWVDGLNRMRFIDLDNLPFKEIVQGTSGDPCDVITTSEIDCNKLNVKPDFYIPHIEYRRVGSEGTITAGTYQFAVQYCNALGEEYTSYYSITNPIPVYDYFKVTPDFNYEVAQSIELIISNLDTTGVFDYFNLAVIKTINNIASVDLVGTFQIQRGEQSIIYTGQSKAGITSSIDEIFQKFPSYTTAGDITTVQDVLVFADLTTEERLNYQQIASQAKLQWVTWKLPPVSKQFSNPINAAKYGGYMRDEVYPFDLVFVLKNGYQTDRFPMVGRASLPQDLIPVSNNDSNFGNTLCEEPEAKPYWKVYNTGSVLGFDPNYDPDDECYTGPYQYGEFAYWQSTDTYPCNEPVWGNLQGRNIRHFKFPDNLVSPHYDNQGNVYPIGVRLDIEQIYTLIKNSNLTEEQKANIAEVKVVRGNRANSKSIVAKGILYNVGKYTRDDTTYFYPNYPYNDLRPDPFISNSSTGPAGQQLFASFESSQSIGGTETDLYTGTIPGDTFDTDGDRVTAVYNGRFSNTTAKKRIRVYYDTQVIFDSGLLTVNETNTWVLNMTIRRVNTNRLDITSTFEIFGQSPYNMNFSSSIVGTDFSTDHNIILTGESLDFPNGNTAKSGDITASNGEITYIPAPSIPSSNLLEGFATTDSNKRFTFHSPDTSFYQPQLGNILKLETAEYGTTRSHFVEVKDHSKYRFPSLESFLTSLAVGMVIGFASGTYGVSTNIFNGSAAFTSFTILNDIIYRLLPKKNMAYQFNSVGTYMDSVGVPNNIGDKIRQIDIGAYLIGAMQGVGDTNIVNNYQRESSVYLRTTNPLPFPDSLQGVPQDNSRFTLGQVGCRNNFYTRDISSYYASIRVENPDQYGQIYSYQAVDTGFQESIDITQPFTGKKIRDIFGGDTFINKFAFKRKLPFFVDNRVNFPDESDVFYDELGNIGFPNYWFSTDVRRGDGGAFNIGALFGVKVNNFDCENSAFFYDAGKIYLFAYGIVNFFVESQVNTDLRQAYNAKEGDYYPHVSGDVPDDWFQETNVPIAFDNTYTYNKTYSKQNIENTFSTLPVDFIPGQKCSERLPNTLIFSEPQEEVVSYKKNNWRIFRPAAIYHLPLNYGKLTSIDGIETRQVLVRFENKAQLYNALLTAASSIGDVYLGQSLFNKNIPPVDFATTDLGYTGSQHKFLLRTEFGHVWIDAQRGDVFVVSGQNIEDISDKDVKMFLTNNLAFQMKEFFPDYNIDNNFKGVGLHGVYDNKYRRLIITKLDYLPLREDIVYNATTDTFTVNGQTIELGDPQYFCDISFTISYYFEGKFWISFHTYLPKFYVGDNNKFYSSEGDSVWVHNISETTYNTYYGVVEPYILEHPFIYQYQDELIQAVKDYTKVERRVDANTFVQTNDIFFNKVIIYNDQQCSGTLNLIPKPKNNMSAYLTYPRYNVDSRDILFVKSDNFYNYNGFWDIVQDYTQPIWLRDCTSDSENKVLNTNNLNYTNRPYKKYSIRAKDCRIRHILDNRGDVRMSSQFISQESQISYK